MGKAKLFCQQYRLATGHHNQWQSKKIGDKKEQNQAAITLASRPGRQSKNWRKQELAEAAVRFLAMLTVVENRPSVASVSLTDTASHEMPCHASRSNTSKSYFHDIQTQNYTSSKLTTGTKYVADHCKNRFILHDKTTRKMDREDKSNFELENFVWPALENVYFDFSSWAFWCDPLKFSSAEAVSLMPNTHFNRNLNVDNAQGRLVHSSPFAEPMGVSQRGYTFITRGLNTIKHFYSDYSIHYPDLVILATRRLREEIKKKFHIELDPHTVYFIQFEKTTYSEGKKRYYMQPKMSHSLISFLFTNFAAKIQNELIDMDAMCGIYAAPIPDKFPVDGSLELKMQPSEFIKLVHDINFYDYAKHYPFEAFDNEDIHVKKCFYDFMLGLQVSRLNNEYVKDVLMAVGLINPNGRNKMTISLFDVHEYVASTLFVFTNQSTRRVTLYLSQSEKKFVSFRSDFDMRSWIMNMCVSERHREMIASHFNIAFRQDRRFSYGVDSLLTHFERPTDSTNKIFTKNIPVTTGKNFFIYLFDQIKIKQISDINYLNTYDTNSRRDMWKYVSDVSTPLPISISPFLSLAMHLEDAIDASNYDKKVKEWNKIKEHDLNIALMVLLDKSIKSNTDGDAFIDMVGNGINNANIKMIDSLVKTFVNIKAGSATPNVDWKRNRSKLITIDNKKGKSVNLFPMMYPEGMPQEGGAFITAGINAIKQFYFKYSIDHPNLTSLATKRLHEEIKKKFHIELDPNAVYFMQFEDVMYSEGKKWHYEHPKMFHTLTSFLFTNFAAKIQNELVDVDAMCGIYATPIPNKFPVDASLELKITPSDFIKLVWDIDFYNYAVTYFDKKFEHVDIHIKKYFYDFMLGLQISTLNNEETKDVLMAVGLIKSNESNEMTISLFDINGYVASTLFVFTNQLTRRITLYLPEGEKKFISFHDDFDMRSWIMNACVSERHREMIASHFKMAFRQDGSLYNGIDSWLKYFEKHIDLSYKIFTKNTPVTTGKNFFIYLCDQMKIKQMSDLTYLINSDAKIKRNMWESLIDASNILPNPISPFLSLVMHLEHAIDAKNYDEKIKEWNKIRYDGLNIVLMVLLDKSIKLDADGYEFINMVKEGMDNVDTKIIGDADAHRVSIEKKNNLSKQRKMTDPNCDRRKRGATFGRLCATDPNHSNSRTLEENNVKMSVTYDETSIQSETRRVAREWFLNDPIDEPNSNDINTLEYLASHMQELPILEDYVEAGSEGINRYLRYGTDTVDSKYQQDALELLSDYPNLQNYNDFSYRILVLPKERLETMEVNDLIADQGFSSTSALIKNARSWMEDGFIKQHKMSDKDYAVIVYDKSIDKKIAGTGFLVDHILIKPSEKLKIRSIETINTNEKQKIWFIGVMPYTGSLSTTDIYTGKMISTLGV